MVIDYFIFETNDKSLLSESDLKQNSGDNNSIIVVKIVLIIKDFCKL